MRVIRTTDSKENLCDACPSRDIFPECMAHVEFGDGYGNDNIIACSNCTCKYSFTIYPGEIAPKEVE